MPDDVDLYALPLEDFVAARNAAARRAATAGDDVGAARIKGLAKPTVAAWTINRVVREHPGEVETLIDLGGRLRAATDARDRAAITALDHDRRTRVDALVAQVAASGEVGGRPVSAEALRRLGETLTAAALDPDAADAVRAAQLGRALQYVGFGVVDEGGGPAEVVSLGAERKARRRADDPGRTAAAGRGSGRNEAAGRGSGRNEAAGRGGPAAGGRDAVTDTSDLDAAEAAVAEADSDLDRLDGERDDAEAARREARGVVGQLADDLKGVDRELKRLARERDALASELDDARAAADHATERVREAEAEIEAAEGRAEQARRRRRVARGRRG